MFKSKILREIYKIFPFYYCVLILLFFHKFEIIISITVALWIFSIFKREFKYILATIYKLKYFILITFILVLLNRESFIESLLESVKIISLIHIGAMSVKRVDITKLLYEFLSICLKIENRGVRVVIVKFLYTLFLTLVFSETLLDSGRKGKKIKKFRKKAPSNLKGKIDFYSKILIYIFKSGLTKAEEYEKILEKRSITPEKLESIEGVRSFTFSEVLFLLFFLLLPTGICFINF